eukprot:2687352-Prymnesium_polylepis.1
MRKALWGAAKADDVRAVGGLLQHGAPAEGELLFTLVRQRRSLACVQALLRARANADVSDSLGTHVLTIALLQGDASLQVVRALLAAGADPTLHEEGFSILQLARARCPAPAVLAALEAHVAGEPTSQSTPPSQRTPP